MSLRESTVPCIANHLRKNADLPGKLQAIVSNFVAKAKADVQDYYEEVTFRKERDIKRKKGPPSVVSSTPESVKTPPFFKSSKEEKKKKTSEIPIERKKTRVLGEESPDEEEQEEAEEEEELFGEEESQEESNDDSDLFSGRFSSPVPGVTGNEVVSSKAGQFDQTLQTMIQQAISCGALARVTCL